MATSLIDGLCLQIRDSLNTAPGGTFSSPYDTWSTTKPAVFLHLPQFTKSNLEDLTVVVTNSPVNSHEPATDFIDRCCDSAFLRRVTVAIQKQVLTQQAGDVDVDKTDQISFEELTDLKNIAEEIAEYCATLTPIVGLKQFGIQGVEFQPFYDDAMLQDDRIFRSIVVLEWL